MYVGMYVLPSQDRAIDESSKSVHLSQEIIGSDRSHFASVYTLRNKGLKLPHAERFSFVEKEVNEKSF